VIVVDASVLATVLIGDEQAAETLRRRLLRRALAAPSLVDLEVVSVLRRKRVQGRLDEHRAGQAVVDLHALPLARAPERPLLQRVWELRHNLTSYDAAYVALAETLRVPLLTGDQRLAAAPGIRCEVELA
jgi:predicted nucleic acid-binding protein